MHGTAIEMQRSRIPSSPYSLAFRYSGLGDAARYQYYDAGINKCESRNTGRAEGLLNGGLSIALLIVLLVVVYVLAKVRTYARKSREQWDEVDKSKLRTWDDDEWK
jgi:hypothetical protein